MLGVHPFMMLRQPLAVAALGVACLLLGEVDAYPLLPVSLALLSGLLGIALCDWCLYESIFRIGIRSTLVCVSLNSCLTALFGVLFLGEYLGMQGILGILIATLGVITVIVAEQRDVHAVAVTPRQRNIGLALALCSAFGLAVSMIVSKEALRLELPALPLAFLRNVAATSIIWIFGLGLHRVRIALNALRENPSVLKLLLAGCFFGPGGGTWLSIVALQHAPAGIAATLIGLQPVTVMIISGIWERRRPTTASILGACIACGGAALLLLR